MMSPPMSWVRNATATLSGLLSAALFVKLSQLTAPVVADRTVHVNSSTGNDTTGDGSSGAPWQTLARAWTDRLTYGELRAKYIVQLHGVGPYTMPVMGASICGDGGYFIVQGDSTVDVAIASGTFTGDLNTTTYALPTSAGLGSDTLKTYFLEITSGNCSGVRTSIVTNTDTSISIPDRQWRTALGAVANGDTFRVFAPGTVINVPAIATGAPSSGSDSWLGGVLLAIGAIKVMRHIFYNVALTLTGQLTFTESSIALVGVRTTGSSFVFMMFQRSRVALGHQPDPSLFLGGSPAANFKLFSYGLSLSDNAILEVGGSSSVMGSYYIGAGGLGLGYVSIGDEWICCGGRHDSAVSINGGRFEMYSGTYEYLHTTSLFSLLQRAQLFIGVGSGSKWVFAVTSGHCVQLTKGSFFGYGNFSTAGISGGTTDAAGYAINMLQGGGTVVIHGGAPVLTGGNGNGNDIKTTNLVRPNSFFAAAGDVMSDMGGAEVVLRA